MQAPKTYHSRCSGTSSGCSGAHRARPSRCRAATISFLTSRHRGGLPGWAPPVQEGRVGGATHGRGNRSSASVLRRK